jgi:hypothetical protein
MGLHIWLDESAFLAVRHLESRAIWNVCVEWDLCSCMDAWRLGELDQAGHLGLVKPTAGRRLGKPTFIEQARPGKISAFAK